MHYNKRRNISTFDEIVDMNYQINTAIINDGIILLLLIIIIIITYSVGTGRTSVVKISDQRPPATAGNYVKHVLNTTLQRLFNKLHDINNFCSLNNK